MNNDIYRCNNCSTVIKDKQWNPDLLICPNCGVGLEKEKIEQDKDVNESNSPGQIKELKQTPDTGWRNIGGELTPSIKKKTLKEPNEVFDLKDISLNFLGVFLILSSIFLFLSFPIISPSERYVFTDEPQLLSEKNAVSKKFNPQYDPTRSRKDEVNEVGKNQSTTGKKSEPDLTDLSSFEKDVRYQALRQMPDLKLADLENISKIWSKMNEVKDWRYTEDDKYNIVPTVKDSVLNGNGVRMEKSKNSEFLKHIRHLAPLLFCLGCALLRKQST